MAQLRFKGLGDIELAADAVGDPEDPPVLLLPAGAQTKRSWAGAAKALADAGRYAITVDLRGHGDSAWAADGRYDLDAYMGDLKAVLAQLPARPIVIGVSIGGIAALVTLGEGTDQLARGLILVGVAPWMNRRLAQDTSRRLAAQIDGFDTIEEAGKAYAEMHPFEGAPDPEALLDNLNRDIDGRYYWRWDPRFLNGMNLKEIAPRLEAAAARISVPTLILKGTLSKMVADEDMKRLQSLIPNAELVDIEGAAHHIGTEQADLFNATLLEFLERRLPRDPVSYAAGSDSRTLRDALGCFGTGVTIVTTMDKAGKPVGLTANSFTSVSLDPPLILFCLARSSSNLPAFEANDAFGVNILHIGQQLASARFASKAAERFESVSWERWDDGAPILNGSLASFDCVKHSVHDAGDHLVIIGRVTRARFEPQRDPLIFFRGKYRRLHFQ